MADYNYLEAVIEDVEERYDEYFEEYDADIQSDREALEKKLNEDMWIDDGITGNASGSYTMNAWQAEENIAHNWDLIEEMRDELFDGQLDILDLGPERVDVYLRCYVLGQAISAVLDEKFEKPETNNDDESEENEDE